MAKTIKERFYGTVADVTRQVKSRTGPVGKTVSGIENAVDNISDGMTQARTEVKEGAHALCVDVRKAGRAIAEKYRELYGSIDKTFFTEGEFDYDKAKAALNDQRKAIGQYGVKAYQSLCDLVERGKDAVVTDFRSYIPTEEEIRTKYAGIGTEYKGVLLREHYDSCLSFISDTENKLPKGTRYRAQILTDIRASASANPAELREFYTKQLSSKDESKSVPDRIKVLDKYFPR